MKKKQNINFILTIAVIVCVTVIIGMVILMCIPDDDRATVDTDTVSTTGLIEGNTGVITDSNDNTNKTFGIETPYCTIQYPMKWKQYLNYTDSEENGVFKQTYYCVLNDKNFEMFSIYFGETEGTTEIGKIMHDGEVIPFSVSSTSAITDSEFTEEEKEIILSMDFAINTIIESVIASENYIG